MEKHSSCFILWNRTVGISQQIIFIALNLALFAYQTIGHPSYVRFCSYYTNFNQILCFFHSVWILYELIKKSKISDQLKQFSLFTMYSSFFVMFGFIVLYNINPSLIYTQKYQNQLNKSLAFYQHGGFLFAQNLKQITSLFQFITVIGPIQASASIKEALISLLLYLLIVYFNYYQSSRFPYPAQKYLGFSQNTAIFLIGASLMIFSYKALKRNIAKIQSEKQQDDNHRGQILKIMIKQIALLYNILQLGLWGFIFCQVMTYSFLERSDSALISTVVKVAQTLQVTDLVLLLIGENKGSLINTLLQLGGRMYVTWVFITPTVCFCSLRNAVIAWSLAEVIRFSYYLMKSNATLKWLRYTAFVILYPFGIVGEMRLVERYKEKNPDFELYGTLFEGILIVGGVFMIYSMLQSRKQALKDGKAKTSVKEGGLNRSQSPVRHKRE